MMVLPSAPLKRAASTGWPFLFVMVTCWASGGNGAGVLLAEDSRHDPRLLSLRVESSVHDPARRSVS